MYYVYLIRNLVNDKVYIGKASDVHKRWLKHLSSVRTGIGIFPIHSAIRKYGVDKFKIITIDSDISESDILEKEKFWIDFYKSNVCKYPYELGYNLTDGGEGISGHKHSDEAKLKISLTFKGKLKSDDHKKLLSIIHTGKILSKSHKDAIGSALIGKKHFDETKVKLKLSKLGTKNPNSKLNEQQVIEIVKLFNTTAKTDKDIGSIFGVAKRTISDIRRGIGWSYLTNISIQSVKSNKVLTKQNVIDILYLIKNGISYKEIGNTFNLSRRYINGIKLGQKWKNLAKLLPFL